MRVQATVHPNPSDLTVTHISFTVRVTDCTLYMYTVYAQYGHKYRMDAMPMGDGVMPNPRQQVPSEGQRFAI